SRFLCWRRLAKGPGYSAIPTPERQIVESALIAPVTFIGEEGDRLSIDERRQSLSIPAVSVAVARDWQLDWSAAYGGATIETRFQAASLSKPVAAAGILTLAENLGVGIDDELSGQLDGLNLDALNPDGLPITLRGLLSHTNGTTVSGFPGYPAGTELPDLTDILTGSEPANTDPVIVQSDKFGSRNYSGGGYQLAQYWAETVSGEPFDALMKRLVLDAVGMPNSTFTLYTPETYPSEDVARAHLSGGKQIDAGWHMYPEQAAAGLWTTPADYVQFVLAVMSAKTGREDAGIRSSVARKMVQPIADEYGLGIGVREIDGEIRLSHSGLNRGYISNFMAYPARGDMVITMTNSSSGFAMVGDVGRTANATYGWPSTPLIIEKRAETSAAELEDFVGLYIEDGNPETTFTLRVDGSELLGETPSGYQFRLVKIGPNKFIDPNDAEKASFKQTDEGKLALSSGSSTYVRQSTTHDEAREHPTPTEE
ncbi:MAG: serine hydrolase domain-containing protein, partial [Pseudomonadota bacterium]